MWYLNYIEQIEGDKHICGFILTMWYLNVVEEVIDVVQENGFILTMWYLNSLSSKSTEFYEIVLY